MAGRAQVSSKGNAECKCAQNGHSDLSSGIHEPLSLRRDAPGVQKRTAVEPEHAIGVKSFEKIGVQENIAATHRSGALSSELGCAVSAKLEIAVAIEAQDEEFIERQLTKAAAEPQPGSGLVIVTSPVEWKPTQRQGSFRLNETFRR